MTLAVALAWHTLAFEDLLALVRRAEDAGFAAVFVDGDVSQLASRGDVYGTAACLTRAVSQLVLVLFALNRTYLVNDKSAFAEIAEFEQAPREFGPRVQKSLAHLGDAPRELVAAVESVAALFRETVELCEGLYPAGGSGSMP